MINITEKKNCSGCTACVSSCPKNCIKMKMDEEGFFYPDINSKECVDCGLCSAVCPIQNPVAEKETPQKAYILQYKDEIIRKDSTAGGAFTAIAAVVIKKGGVVFGAAYDENFHVRHEYVETIEEIGKFRNSKYVQSDLGDCFRQAKKFLEDDRWVCFSGTPCQIEGLKSFLRKPYEKLVLVDVVCHGVPSPLIWEKYLEYQGLKEDKPENIRFRDKYYGYKYSTMSIIRDGKNIYHAGSQLDPMLRAFLSGICDRPACYDCMFKKRYRVSDITIWDGHSVSEFDKKMDDDRGTTNLLCHSEKGNDIFQQMTQFIKYKEVSPNDIIKGSKKMFSSVEMNKKRNKFFEDAQNMNGRLLFNKYYPITVKVRIKTFARKVLLVTGLYSVSKKIKRKLKNHK